MESKFSNKTEMKAYVEAVLESKNIQTMPRTLSLRMADFASAEFFGNTKKMQSYHDAIVKFCEALKSREFKNLPESVKSDVLPLEVLQNKAIIHARRVRELAELRARLLEKESEVENSLGRIPYAQRDEFGKLLVTLQNVVASEA